MAVSIASENILLDQVTAGELDPQSGSWLERWVFNHRGVFVVFCLLATLFLAFQATRLVVNAGFDKVIPGEHPYIKNYLDNKPKLAGLGNSLRVVVENTGGEIFETEFLKITQQLNQDLFLTPGVDRPWVKSIWMSSVRWTEVTKDGFRGGPVVPQDYGGTPEQVAKVRERVLQAGLLGTLVSSDLKSLMIVVPLLDKDPDTGKALDYAQLSRRLDEIRDRYQGAAGGKVAIHVTGFAELIGQLLGGMSKMLAYFMAAALIATGFIYAYTRCARCTAAVVGASFIAVVWQLGFVSLFGYELDPYSVLVPFLIFAIGVSHGAQKMNGIMRDVARGADRYVAARLTFRRLFLAGLTAIICDAAGFAVLMMIDIPVIKDLAITASIGVAVLVFTNLLLLPIVLSYTGVSPQAAQRNLEGERVQEGGRGVGAVWDVLTRFTEGRWALAAVAGAALLLAGGAMVRSHLTTGDLHAGAPELWPESRYNRDVVYVNDHYRLSSDQFVVMVQTPAEGCASYATLKQAERLTLALQEMPEVIHATALPDNVRNTVAGLNEGSPKWITISRDERLIGSAVQFTMTDQPETVDKACTTMPVVAYLKDHKAETLARMIKMTEEFAQQNSNAERKFLLTAGSAGIAAVTNIVVENANRTMLFYVFAAVIALCWITFRSWRAVIVAVVPLIITAVLVEAFMVALGIGMKVATLPVVALGVGIGVDYALYLLSVQLALQRQGVALSVAYRRALAFTGKVVALIGVTMAAGVVLWAFSPIKFQADMGILLTFSFLWNMIGALVLMPALCRFLLPTSAVTHKGPTAAPAETSSTSEYKPA
jgi:predicted RND superfamily exporter protein